MSANIPNTSDGAEATIPDGACAVPVDVTSSDTETEPDVSTDSSETESGRKEWYALRDLTRVNAKRPGYKILSELGIEIFTPMQWKVVKVRGKRKRVQSPVLIDMLFAHADRETMDEVLSQHPNIQYRYARGAYCKPIVVRDIEMERFIRATTMTPDPVYYSPVEITQLSIGRDIRIIGGAMEGIEGKIINVRGARKKRILVSIPDFIATMVEVDPEFLEFI